MDKSISLDMIKSYQENSSSDLSLKLSRNAATHNEITDLAMDWDEYRKIDHTFSEQITGKSPRLAMIRQTPKSRIFHGYLQTND